MESDWSLQKLSKDFSLKLEHMDSLFCPEKLAGFEFAVYFHAPIPPVCFHSLYDFNARTQFTTLEAFPPCKKKFNQETLISCECDWRIISPYRCFNLHSNLFQIRGLKSWKPHFLNSYTEVSHIFKVLVC